MLRPWGLGLILFFLTGCSSATPPPVAPPDPNLRVLNLDPGANNFLLTSEGTAYIDLNGQKLAELKLKDGYSSRLALRWTNRLNPANQRQTYALTVTLDGPTDSTHTFSDNKPTAAMEVDGAELGTAIQINNLKNSDPPRLEIALSPVAVKSILGAKKQVSIKAQLKSDRIARSNSCFSDTNSVDDYLNCRFPYTGRNLTDKDLAALKMFLANPNSP